MLMGILSEASDPSSENMASRQSLTFASSASTGVRNYSNVRRRGFEDGLSLGGVAAGGQGGLLKEGVNELRTTTFPSRSADQRSAIDRRFGLSLCIQQYRCCRRMLQIGGRRLLIADIRLRAPDSCSKPMEQQSLLLA